MSVSPDVLDIKQKIATIDLMYIAVDGSLPTPCPRGKEKFVDFRDNTFVESSIIDDRDLIKDWDWDGSSVNQAEGSDSDKILRPVRYYSSPFKPDSHLVLSEVLNFDGTSHASNSRGHLRDALKNLANKEIWMAVEQEYFILQLKQGMPIDLNAAGLPVGFNSDEEIKKYVQGGDYCSATNPVNEVMEQHSKLCHAAGIYVCGINAEVAPAQGEFQVLAQNPLELADDLTIARYLLLKLCATRGVTLSLRPKLYPNLNGSGAHLNFSDEKMRNPGGLVFIYQARERLEANYNQIIKVCGAYNDVRLTGDHETAKIGTFNIGKDKSDRGVGDRGASARIPRSTYRDGHGRCELRIPAANMDPYKVATAIIESVWGDGFNAESHGWVYRDKDGKVLYSYV